MAGTVEGRASLPRLARRRRPVLVGPGAGTCPHRIAGELRAHHRGNPVDAIRWGACPVTERQVTSAGAQDEGELAETVLDVLHAVKAGVDVRIESIRSVLHSRSLLLREPLPPVLVGLRPP